MLYYHIYVYGLNLFLYACRETLHIKTKSQELIALLITHAKDILKDSIAVMPDVLNCLYDDDLFPVNSKDEGYTFRAMHLEPAYNRYSEQVSSLCAYTGSSIIKLI